MRVKVVLTTVNAEKIVNTDIVVQNKERAETRELQLADKCYEHLLDNQLPPDTYKDYRLFSSLGLPLIDKLILSLWEVIG